MTKFFANNDTRSAFEAQYEAQKIAFAPIIFQTARTLRDLGILKYLLKHYEEGRTLEQIAEEKTLSKYGVQTLLETALSADIVKQKDERFFITRVGRFLQEDEMTRINMNYNHHVNYLGLFHLDDSVKKGKAAGLTVFSNEHETIYPILSNLPENTRKSWFKFDHYYSDSAFPKAVEILMRSKPRRILDIGGNTGRFSIEMAKAHSNIQITIADLPQQIELATVNVVENNLQKQINFAAFDVLDHSESLPSGYDVIWMSQFLDCFKEEDVVALLQRVKNTLNGGARLYIMEPLWDRQKFETSAFCIINTSPYFTAMANGYSKMFKSDDLIDLIERAGLEVTEIFDNLGICQSLLVCK